MGFDPSSLQRGSDRNRHRGQLERRDHANVFSFEAANAWVNAFLFKTPSLRSENPRARFPAVGLFI